MTATSKETMMEEAMFPERTNQRIWRVYSMPERGWFVFLFFILSLLLIAFFAHPDFAYRSAATANVVSLQRAFSVSKFREILLTWQDLRLFKQSVRQLDFLFPLVYAGFLAFAYAWSRRQDQPGFWDRGFFLAPWLAALCDYSENGLHLYLLRGIDSLTEARQADFSAVLVFTAACFASLKIALLGLASVAILGLLLRNLWWLMRQMLLSGRTQWSHWLQRGLDYLPYLYLLRVPALTSLFLLGLPFLACFTGARGILEGLFDVPGQRLFWVALTAFLLAWTSMATLRLLLVYGPCRFEITSFFTKKFGWSLFLWHGGLALPIVLTGIILSRSGMFWPPLGSVLFAIAGLLAALVLLYAATWLHLFFSPSPGAAETRLMDPTDRIDFLLPASFPGQQWLNRAYTDAPLPAWTKRFNTWIVKLPEYFGIGYVDYVRCQVFTGHLLALALLVLSLLVYVWAGLPGYQLFSQSRLSLTLPYIFPGLLALALLFVARHAPKRAFPMLARAVVVGLLLLGLFTGHYIRIPALAYLLWLCLLLCWGLSALAFFFDRFRLPVLIPLVLWVAVTAQFPYSDHYYHLIPTLQTALQSEPLTPAQTLQADQLRTEPSPLIVVAASGGGIQAAAWVVQVLTGLEAQNPQQFSRHVRLISAVSGGSVGAMYFANAYRSDGTLDQGSLPQIADQAMSSSLDAVGWGLVYPDFLRLVCLPCVPFLWNMDRGQALEQAWLQAKGVSSSTLTSATLATWKADVQAGRRPAVIFNTTLTDTGERLLLATSASSQNADRAGSRSFASLYPNYDLRIVTAARLSATFPYASPAARADLPKAQYHVVDGGYYDNFGISSLAQWLVEAQASNLLKRVLILQIRAFPEEGNDQQTASQPAEQPPTQRGWFYQAFAPLSTLLNVRTAGQRAHNQIELDLLQQVLAQSGITLERALFEFRGVTPEAACPSHERNYHPPLSWHLTQHQKEELQREWDRLKDCPEARKVKAFLAPTLPQNGLSNAPAK